MKTLVQQANRFGLWCLTADDIINPGQGRSTPTSRNEVIDGRSGTGKKSLYCTRSEISNPAVNAQISRPLAGPCAVPHALNPPRNDDMYGFISCGQGNRHRASSVFEMRDGHGTGGRKGDRKDRTLTDGALNFQRAPVQFNQ